MPSSLPCVAEAILLRPEGVLCPARSKKKLPTLKRPARFALGIMLFDNKVFFFFLDVFGHFTSLFARRKSFPIDLRVRPSNMEMMF